MDKNKIIDISTYIGLALLLVYIVYLNQDIKDARGYANKFESLKNYETFLSNKLTGITLNRKEFNIKNEKRFVSFLNLTVCGKCFKQQLNYFNSIGFEDSVHVVIGITNQNEKSDIARFVQRGLLKSSYSITSTEIVSEFIKEKYFNGAFVSTPIYLKTDSSNTITHVFRSEEKNMKSLEEFIK